MTLTFFKEYARSPGSAPTAAGTVDAINGFEFAYRIATRTGHSAMSPLTASKYAFPVTLSWPEYPDTSLTVEYEVFAVQGGQYVLVGSTSGTTLAVGSVILPQQIATPVENFAEGLAVSDLGLYNSTDSPVFTFYARNSGAALNGLQWDVSSELGTPLPELYGKVILTINGVIDVTGWNTNFNANYGYTDAVIGSRQLDIDLEPGDIVSFSVQLVGYEAGAFGSRTNGSFVLSIDSLGRTFPLPLHDIYFPALIFNQKTYWPLGTVTGSVLAFNGLSLFLYGQVVVIGAKTVQLGASPQTLTAQRDGTIRAVQVGGTFDPVREFPIATLTGGAFGPLVNYAGSVRISGELLTNCLMGQPLYWSAGKLTTTDTGLVAGAAMADGTTGTAMNAITNGICFVRTTASSVSGLGNQILSTQFGNHKLYSVRV